MSRLSVSFALAGGVALVGCVHPVIAGASGFGGGVPLDCRWRAPGEAPACEATADIDPKRFTPIGGRYASVPDCKMTDIGVAAPASSRPTFVAACGPGPSNTWACPTIPAGGEPGTGSRTPACVRSPETGAPLRPLPSCTGRIIGLRVGRDLLAVCGPPENPL